MASTASPPLFFVILQSSTPIPKPRILSLGNKLSRLAIWKSTNLHKHPIFNRTHHSIKPFVPSYRSAHHSSTHELIPFHQYRQPPKHIPSDRPHYCSKPHTSNRFKLNTQTHLHTYKHTYKNTHPHRKAQTRRHAPCTLHTQPTLHTSHAPYIPHESTMVSSYQALFLISSTPHSTRPIAVPGNTKGPPLTRIFLPHVLPLCPVTLTRFSSFSVYVYNAFFFLSFLFRR